MSENVNMPRVRTRNERIFCNQEDIKDLLKKALKPLREDLSHNNPDKNYFDNVVDKLMTQINVRLQAQDDKIKKLEDQLEKLENQNFEEAWKYSKANWQ